MLQEMFSLIIPVYNEEGTVERTVREADSVLRREGEDYEIIVVDDGSRDATSRILASLDIPRLRVLTHAENKGNGTAIMTAAAAARGAILGTVDADATYPIRDFPKLLRKKRELGVSMIIGCRTKPGAAIPFPHRAAKAILRRSAERETGARIPDINSGMRVFDAALFDRFLRFYPPRFSLHIALTLCAVRAGEKIWYEPIEYYRRIGKSQMTAGLNGFRHFFLFLQQIHTLCAETPSGESVLALKHTAET